MEHFQMESERFADQTLVFSIKAIYGGETLFSVPATIFCPTADRCCGSIIIPAGIIACRRESAALPARKVGLSLTHKMGSPRPLSGGCSVLDRQDRFLHPLFCFQGTREKRPPSQKAHPSEALVPLQKDLTSGKIQKAAGRTEFPSLFCRRPLMS